MMSPIRLTIASVSVLAYAAIASAQQPAPVSDPDAAEIAAEAYVFGYPLVTMYVTERVQTNVATPQADGHAPVNQFGSLFKYPTAAFKDVTAPNVNTLYSSVWLDLSEEPIVIHVPNTHGRYYVMEILDSWTNVFASPGKRTTGTDAQEIAILGPSWTGELPPAIDHAYRSPTNTAWVLVRIQANGSKDYPVVNALQRELSTTPLSDYGKAFSWTEGKVDPSIDMKDAGQGAGARHARRGVFGILAEMTEVNQPAAADSLVLERMARIGIRPGEPFDLSGTDAETADEIRKGARVGLEKIEQHSKTVGTIVNGWQILTICGEYGTNYLTRAAVTLIGLGCNLPEDAIYPTTTVDADGNTLTGANRYVLRFPAGQTPPANAFLVGHHVRPRLLPGRESDRSRRDQVLERLEEEPDGSLDLYIQHESPGSEKESNWLPAPAGDFVLMLRLCWPEQARSTAPGNLRR